MATIDNLNYLPTYLVGCTSIGDSWYARSRHSGRLFESCLIVSADYRGRRVGKEATLIELALGRELGYAVTVNDFLASNRRMTSIIRQMFGTNATIVGNIARGTYTAGAVDGWDDQVITFHDIRASGIPTFSEIATRSRQLRGTTAAAAAVVGSAPVRLARTSASRQGAIGLCWRPRSKL